MAVDKNAWSIRAEKSVVDNNIDWGTVASKVTTELETIRDDRQVRKDAIDEATNSMMNELAKGEDINNATLSTALIDGGQSASEALQIQVNLMKKGLIKPRDYKIFLQKQQNAYTNLKNVVQNWDKWETKSNERLAQDPNSGLIIASVLERDFNSATSAFGNMENVKFIPTETGGMEAVRLIESPDCSEEDKAAGTCSMVMPNRQDNPDNFMNPNVVGTRQKFEQNTLDINAAMKGQVDALGAFLRTEGGAIFKSTNDFIQSPKYKNAKRLSIDAILAGGKLSLANVAGSMGYRFAQSEEQKEKMMREEGVSGSKIIMYTSTDGKPKFADGAFNIVTDGDAFGAEAMRSYLGDKFDVQLADETKLVKGLGRNEPDTVDKKLKEIEKQTGNYIKSFDKILTSKNQGEVESALDGFIQDYNGKITAGGKGLKIKDVIFTGDLIQLVYEDDSKSTGIQRTYDDDNDASTPNIKTDIADQIYRLGEELEPGAFNNIQDVKEWLSNNPDYTVGDARQKDKLTVRYGGKDYNFEDETIMSPNSPLMDKQPWRGSEKNSPMDGDNISVADQMTVFSNMVNDMLPKNLRDDFARDGLEFDISNNFKNDGKDFGSETGGDQDGAIVYFKLKDANGEVMKNSKGEDIEYQMSMKTMKEYATGLQIGAGDVNYTDYAKEINNGFLKKLRLIASKRKTGRSTTGSIDTSQY